MSTMNDEQLGARLRTALQDLTPLATDPAPTPRFATPVHGGPTTDGPTADVVELGAPHPRRSPRSRVVATAVLMGAAAAAVVLVATTGTGRTPTTGPAGGPTSAAPVPLSTATIPDRGGADLGVVPDPDPWRCTAPAGTTLAAFRDDRQVRSTVWAIGAGMTCAPFAADRDRFGFSEDGYSADLGVAMPTNGVIRRCLYVGTRASEGRDPSFVSRGAGDYVEFYGPDCRLRLPAPR